MAAEDGVGVLGDEVSEAQNDDVEDGNPEFSAFYNGHVGLLMGKV